jgi:hypothetical protein
MAGDLRELPVVGRRALDDTERNLSVMDIPGDAHPARVCEREHSAVGSQ